MRKAQPTMPKVGRPVTEFEPALAEVSYERTD